MKCGVNLFLSFGEWTSDLSISFVVWIVLLYCWHCRHMLVAVCEMRRDLFCVDVYLHSWCVQRMLYVGVVGLGVDLK